MAYEYFTKSTIYTIKIPSFLVFLTSNFAITHFRRFLWNFFKLNYDCGVETYLLAKFEALHTNISLYLLYSLQKFKHFVALLTPNFEITHCRRFLLKIPMVNMIVAWNLIYWQNLKHYIQRFVVILT